MWKKMTAVALAVCMLCTLIVPAFGASGKLGYKSAAFLGDSISLGFSFLNDDLDQAYEFDRNVLSQKVKENGNSYTWAYPFQFGEIAGIDLNHVYNYGMSGAMADDIAVLLTADPSKLEDEFSKVGGFSMLREPFMEAAVYYEENGDFVTEMQKNVANSELVALAIGGNDVYQNFLYSFQYPDSMEKVEKMGIFGVLVNIVTMLMQFETSWEDIFDTLNNLEEMLGLDSGSDEETASLQETGDEEGSEEGGETGGLDMDLSGLISLDAVKQLVEYFSKENIKDFFFNTQEGYEKSIIQDWEDAYSEIVASINEMNPDADIALISQYNPFGIQNYIGFIRQRVESGEFLKDVKLDTYTAARLVRTLLSALTEAEQNQGDTNKVNEILAKALAAVLDEVLPVLCEEKEVFEYTYVEGGTLKTKERTQTLDEFLKDHPELTAGSVVCTDTGKTKIVFTDEDNAALYELVQDLCYPVMTLMVGTGLQTVYDPKPPLLLGRGFRKTLRYKE